MRLILCVLLGLSAPAFAKAKAKATAKPTTANKRALADLAGKFKWGMSVDDCVKVVADELHVKYEEQLKKETDVYRQDQLRKQEQEDTEKFRSSVVKFEGGAKTGWDTSIVDREFTRNNDESMMLRWEKDQRRFLFFWHGKLYKQFIAFNAEHPAFAGKTFDDFAKILEGRYGKSEMKLAAMRTKDDVQLDHIEWPADGDYSLWAIDLTNFYGNYCMKLFQTSTAAALDKSRGGKGAVARRSNAAIDAVTAPDANKTDANEGIVDQILGGKAATGQIPNK